MDKKHIDPLDSVILSRIRSLASAGYAPTVSRILKMNEVTKTKIELTKCGLRDRLARLSARGLVREGYRDMREKSWYPQKGEARAQGC